MCQAVKRRLGLKPSWPSDWLHTQVRAASSCCQEEPGQGCSHPNCKSITQLLLLSWCLFPQWVKPRCLSFYFWHLKQREQLSLIATGSFLHLQRMFPSQATLVLFPSQSLQNQLAKSHFTRKKKEKDSWLLLSAATALRCHRDILKVVGVLV